MMSLYLLVLIFSLNSGYVLEAIYQKCAFITIAAIKLILEKVALHYVFNISQLHLAAYRLVKY